MIKITGRPATPPSLQTRRIIETKQELADKFERGEGIVKSDYHSMYWRAEDVREALWESQHGKCCFCENKRARQREFDAEHFRPKAGVEGNNEHLGYWWLAYEWDNLLYACKPCNQEYKKNKFPVRGTRANRPEDSLEDEMPKLINPINEDPESYIGFVWHEAYGKYVKAVGLDEEKRGSDTIQIVGLNSRELMEERSALIPHLEFVVRAMHYAKYSPPGTKSIIDEMAKIIKDLTSSNHRFTAFHRAYFRAAGLGDYVIYD